MATYRVTAPFVNAKVTTPTGPTVVGYYEGAILPESTDPAHLQHLLDIDMVEEVELLEVDGAEPPPDEEPEPLGAAPARSAPKADWEAYARAQGATDADLEGKTKEDLVAAYGAQV